METSEIVNQLLSKALNLLIISCEEYNDRNSIYQTEIRKYHNQEKGFYIYFTNFIHLDDLNLVLDEIESCATFDTDSVKHIEVLITESIVKIYSETPISETYVTVAIRRNDKWARILSDFPIKTEFGLRFKDAPKKLRDYIMKEDYARTYQQSLDHITSLEATVAAHQELSDMLAQLDGKKGENVVSEKLQLDVKTKKARLNDIIDRL